MNLDALLKIVNIIMGLLRKLIDEGMLDGLL